MNILDYYKPKVLGVILDQPKTEKIKCPIGSNIKNILMSKLFSLDPITDKFGVTLTFNQKKFNNDDPKYIHRLIVKKITKSRIWKDVKYILFPEFDKNGNLHYHGVIWGVYQIKCIRCVKWWRRNFGFAKPELEIKYYVCKCKEVCERRSINSWCWVHYISKDFGKTGLWSLYNI